MRGKGGGVRGREGCEGEGRAMRGKGGGVRGKGGA